MELTQTVKILWRWSWLVMLVAVIAGAGAFWGSRNLPPVYQATTTLLVHQIAPGSVGAAANALSASDNPPQTVSELLQSRPVINEVIGNLKLNTDYDTFTNNNLSITIIRGTPLLQLSVRDPDARRAADIANEIPRVFGEQNRDVQQGTFAASEQYLQQEVAKAELAVNRTQATLNSLRSSDPASERDRLQMLLSQESTQYQTLLQNLAQIRLQEMQQTDALRVTDPAVPPALPVFPRPLLFSLLAAIVCGMLATGAVFLREMVDDVVKSSEDVERLTGARPLGLIARIRGSQIAEKLVTATDKQSPVAEAYRVLGAKVEFSEVGHPIRTIVVTSSVPLEGKSTTVANLAVALAQSGKRVILVDTDLRLPRLHTIFQQDNVRGVTTALAENRDDGVMDHLVSTGVDDLYLMPSGPIPANPVGLLGSQRMAKLIEELESQGDVVLFDSPPVLGVVDATLLAHACDAVLLVARGGLTRASAFTRARDELLGSGAFLVGAVLNHVSPPSDSYHTYHLYQKQQQESKSLVSWRQVGLRDGSHHDKK